MKKNIYKTEYKPKKSKWHILENILFIAVLMIFIKVMFFNFMYVSAEVHGKSMQPNLNPTLVGETERTDSQKDIVFVNKYAKFTYGDIVVVRGQTPLVKRVIALGGDELRYELDVLSNNYILYLNDEKVNEDYEVITLTYENIHEPFNNTSGPFGLLASIDEEKENCKDIDGDGTFETYIVPHGKVFVMGDNRPNSTDSRSMGAFSYDNIAGKVERVLPYGTSKISYFFNVLFI